MMGGALAEMMRAAWARGRLLRDRNIDLCERIAELQEELRRAKTQAERSHKGGARSFVEAVSA